MRLLLVAACSAAIPQTRGQEPVRLEVRLDSVPDGPPLVGTLITPGGAGLHPAALLVSPAGEHPRDELRRGGSHLADLAERLARAGIASLRVDNPGVGDSRSDTAPQWSYDVSLEDQARDLAARVAWLRDRPGIDRNRTGLVAHGDGTLPAAMVGALPGMRRPAFTVLLSPSGTRALEDIVRRQVAQLPENAAARREDIAAQLQAAFESLVEEGATDAVKSAFGECMVAFGLPAEQARQQGAMFAERFGTRWHRDYLGHRPRATFRAIQWPVLVLLADDDERVDASATHRTIDSAFRSAGAFNSRVVRIPAGGHFLEPDDERKVLRAEVIAAIRRFVADATGFLAEPTLPAGDASPPELLIEAVQVVDVAAGAVLGERTVHVREGRIVAVSKQRPAELPEGVVTVDGSGRFLIPGLWECHGHATLWGPDALSRLVAHGVTTLRDMGGDALELTSWRQRVRAGEWLGPRMLLAGPFLDGDKPNDQYRLVVNEPGALPAALDELSEAGADFVKVHSRLPIDVMRELPRAAEQRDLLVCGHVPVGMTPLTAIELGMRSIEHADTFLSALARAEPAPVEGWAGARKWWQGEDGKAALARIAEHGTFVVPTLTIVDHCAGRLGGVFQAIQPWTVEMTARLHGAGVPLAAGTDFARRMIGVEPGAALHRELQLLVEAGLSPAEALRAATLTPAEMMRREERSGRVAPGCDADLVLLRANPLADIANSMTIEGVVVRGQWLPRARLDEVLAALRELRER